MRKLELTDVFTLKDGDVVYSKLIDVYIHINSTIKYIETHDDMYTRKYYYNANRPTDVGGHTVQVNELISRMGKLFILSKEEIPLLTL
jgi:hypothetical protein